MSTPPKQNRPQSATSASGDPREDAMERVERAEREARSRGDDLHRSASDMAENVSAKLKNVGVDTDVMAQAAHDQMTELQRLLADELRARPFRALGVAAAVGFVFALMTTR